MDQHLLANLLAWSAQVLCIAALGALLPRLLRVEAPNVRHAYYRVLLALCLVLPWLQGRHATESGAAGSVSTSVTLAVTGVTAPAPGEGVSGGLPWLTILGAVLAAGILARLAWMAVGLARLRRLRTAGYVASGTDELAQLEAAVGSRAEIRYVPGLGQPVTFGVRRPVVLLPEALATLQPPIRRAVLCHELLHVRRRDWAWLLLEEGVRAALWFHPGVWWLISRVQLTREEVVDALAVRLTGSRRGYAEALTAFADEIPVVPAAAFGRRHHLMRRVRLIAREDGSSSLRLALSCAAMAVLVATGGWLATGTFPMRVAAAQEVLTEMGPLERQARPITPENPVPRRIASLDPLYPSAAMGVGMHAVVTQMITVDAGGRVAEVRGIEERVTGLDVPNVSQRAIEAALQAIVESTASAVRQWVFDAPLDPPIAIRVSFVFAPDAVRLTSYSSTPVSTARREGPVETLVVGPDGATVRRPEASRTNPSPGRPASASEPSRVPAVGAPSGRAGAIEPAAAAEPPREPVRVGGNLRPPTKTKDARPEYPAIAQSARVQGVVILETVIAPNGTVQDAKVLRSIPLLDQAALDAVRQWEFTPTLMNGAAVPVIMTVTVQFTLSDEGPPSQAR